MRKMLVVMAVAVFLTVSGSTATAATPYIPFHLTFTGAFQLPGVVLPAGTYTFDRVAPNVVRVRSLDHKTIYGTFMTMPTLNAATTRKQIVFGEACECAPPPVAAWFPYPEPAFHTQHRSVGFRFLY